MLLYAPQFPTKLQEFSNVGGNIARAACESLNTFQSGCVWGNLGYLWLCWWCCLTMAQERKLGVSGRWRATVCFGETHKTCSHTIGQ